MKNLAKSNQKIEGEPKPLFGKTDKGKLQQTIDGKHISLAGEDLLRSKPLTPNNDKLFGEDNIRCSQKRLQEAWKIKKPNRETFQTKK